MLPQVSMLNSLSNMWRKCGVAQLVAQPARVVLKFQVISAHKAIRSLAALVCSLLLRVRELTIALILSILLTIPIVIVLRYRKRIALTFLCHSHRTSLRIDEHGAVWVDPVWWRWPQELLVVVGSAVLLLSLTHVLLGRFHHLFNSF